MFYNAVDWSSEYAWLFLAAIGLGAALGSLLLQLYSSVRGAETPQAASALVRAARNPLLQISLMLSFSLAAILAAMSRIEIAAIDWNSVHAIFFAAAAGFFLILRLLFRYLAAPLVLLLIVFIVVLSFVEDSWIACPEEGGLMEMQVLSQGNGRTALELKPFSDTGSRELSFEEIPGEDVLFSLRSLELPRWWFFSSCKRFARLISVDSPQASPPDFPPLKGTLGCLEAIGLVRCKEHVLTQRGLSPLQSYLIRYDERIGDFTVSPKRSSTF